MQLGLHDQTMATIYQSMNAQCACEQVADVKSTGTLDESAFKQLWINLPDALSTSPSTATTSRTEYALSTAPLKLRGPGPWQFGLQGQL